MSGFWCFVKKEFMENVRNFKMLILFGVFLIFGVMSPLLAKLTPLLFQSINLEGFSIEIPDATVIDSYAQLFHNLTQMGMIVLLILFCGGAAQEISRGTAVLVFARGLPRTTFLLAKLAVQGCLWTAACVLSAAVCYGVTQFLFPGGTPSGLPFSLFCLWVFGMFALAAASFWGVAGKGSFAPLLLTAATIGVLLVLSMIPSAAVYLPTALASYNADLLTGSKSAADLLPSLVITAAVSVGFVAASIVLFRKKQIG